MLGTIINAAAIIVGGGLGLLLKKGIPERIKQTCMHVLALSILIIGIQGALKIQNMLLAIISLVIGGFVGELLQIEKQIQTVGDAIEQRVAANSSGFSHAFVTTSLVVCVGSMAIVGALESGLTGNHATLFAKAVLDGVLCIIFASAMGAGVLFSAVPILLYQGGITLFAGFIRPFMTEEVIGEISATGSFLIIALALNMFGILDHNKIRVGNLLPAVLGPVIWFALQRFI